MNHSTKNTTKEAAALNYNNAIKIKNFKKIKIMSYKLKELPKEVYYLTTKQFTLVDDNSEEYEIRIGESSKGTEYFIWKDGQGGWNDLDDGDILEYLDEGFHDDEGEFEYNNTKEEEKKMDEVMEKFIKENGEITTIKLFDDVVSEMMRVQDYSKDYYRRFYIAVHYAKNKLK